MIIAMEIKEESLYGAIQACLLGAAVADALGLPFEGITAQRILKFNPLPLRQRFLLKEACFQMILNIPAWSRYHLLPAVMSQPF